MPASTIVSAGGRFRLYGDAVRTFDHLPLATYGIAFSVTEGYSLYQLPPLLPGGEKIYGSHTQRVERVLRSYTVMDRSLGVILSGDKGMGKSLMLRLLAEQARARLGLPTVLVQNSTPGLAAFLDELGEVFVVFDEFEKVFDGGDDNETPQNQFLPLFDGISATKRLYALSVNDLSRVSEFMLNRPGRFHYHLRFAYPEADDIATYLRDQVPGVDQSEVDAVVEFSRKYNLNFDHLRAIAFELSHGETFDSVIGELNIKRVTGRQGTLVDVCITWKGGEKTVFNERVDLFNLDGLQSVEIYGVTVRLCMKDALSTPNGYVFNSGKFELTVTDNKQFGNAEATSVVLTRVQSYRIDF